MLPLWNMSLKYLLVFKALYRIDDFDWDNIFINVDRAFL